MEASGKAGRRESGELRRSSTQSTLYTSLSHPDLIRTYISQISAISQWTWACHLSSDVLGTQSRKRKIKAPAESQPATAQRVKDSPELPRAPGSGTLPWPWEGRASFCRNQKSPLPSNHLIWALWVRHTAASHWNICHVHPHPPRTCPKPQERTVTKICTFLGVLYPWETSYVSSLTF